MTRVWRIVRHRTVATILVIAVLLAGWNLGMALIGPGKVSAELSAEIAAGETRLRIAVTLPFEPERFHMLEMQKYGTVMLVDGHDIHVRGVDGWGVQEISRLYWVSSITELDS